jgi:hypothetical protein
LAVISPTALLLGVPIPPDAAYPPADAAIGAWQFFFFFFFFLLDFFQVPVTIF